MYRVGIFQIFVMLAIHILEGEEAFGARIEDRVLQKDVAYGKSIADTLKNYIRRPSYEQVYVALKRLKEKGFVQIISSPKSKGRGRPRVAYKLTKRGARSLYELVSTIEKMDSSVLG